MQDLLAPINELNKRNEQHFIEASAALAKWSSAAVKALPDVRDSEYGTRKEGLDLVMFTQAQLNFVLGKDRVRKRQELWEKYMRVHIIVFQKLDNFAAGYSQRKDLSDLLKLTLAKLMLEGYESILDMNSQASRISSEAGYVQYEFNCKALRDCKDPRQEKLSSGR
jgi:hypothetical protein